MDLKQPIGELLDNVRKVYLGEQIAKGIKASGKSADSLKWTAGTSAGVLVGSKYFRQQKVGRRPGKFPPIADILDWIRYKGINPVDITERSLAFIIARKIAEQGTDIYQGKRKGLEVDEQIDKLVEGFKLTTLKKFKREIINIFKR